MQMHSLESIDTKTAHQLLNLRGAKNRKKNLLGFEAMMFTFMGATVPLDYRGHIGNIFITDKSKN